LRLVHQSQGLFKATLKLPRRSQLVAKGGALNGIALRLCQSIFQEGRRFVGAAVTTEQVAQIYKRCWIWAAY
jgi:hypothetical protein